MHLIYVLLAMIRSHSPRVVSAGLALSIAFVGIVAFAPLANAAQSVYVNCRLRASTGVQAIIAGVQTALPCDRGATYVGSNSFTKVRDTRGSYTVWFGNTQAGGVFPAGYWADISNRAGQEATIVLRP